MNIVHGWTGPLDFVLQESGVAKDLSGLTVGLILKDKDGNAINATVQVVDAVAGKVRYLPGANDLSSKKSPYTAHWKVTDGSNKDVFYPSGEADSWTVYPQ